MADNVKPYVLILAGGVGSRFWPASREALPKQFLDITGIGKSLLRLAYERALEITSADHVYVVTHRKYYSLVRRSLPDLSNAQIIQEPSRNNTAASIALASMKINKHDPDAICVILSADHIIKKTKEFVRVIQKAVEHARTEDSIITLGIEPTRPDTGYGYIEYNKQDNAEVRKVTSFREKPDRETAEAYLQSGSFAWNAGIFIWSSLTILRAFMQYAPGIYDVLSGGMEVYNTTDEEKFLSTEYPKTESISVDYAILERAKNVYTIPCDLGWSDLGTWASLHDHLEKDKSGNVLLNKLTQADEVKDSIVFAKNPKLIIVKGLEGYIVVDTDDALLIYPKKDEQAIKEVREALKKKDLDKYL